MRIAVAYENGNIFQHFGHTGAFKMYDVGNDGVVTSQIVETGGNGHGALEYNPDVHCDHHGHGQGDGGASLW